MSKIDELPYLGLGAGVWPSHIPLMFGASMPPVEADYVELYADDLEELGESLPPFPVNLRTVLHGTQLSPAGADPVPLDLVRRTRFVADRLQSPWIVEDLGTWRLDGRRPLTAPFWPPVMDRAMLRLVCDRLDALSCGLGRPFLCEVPPLDIFVGDFPLPRFFRKLVERTDAPLVLDVSHWLKYAQIVGGDPVQLWAEFPFEHVAELHISGGNYAEGKKWYDEEHSAPLLSECVELLIAAAQRAPALRAVTLEAHGALPDIIRAELASLAEIPEIALLRDKVRDDRRTRSAAYVPEVEELDGWEEILSRPGPASLLRRQRSIRDILEDPAGFDRYLDGSMVLPEGDRALLRQTSEQDWLEASNYRIGRLHHGLPQISKKVLDRLGQDMGSIYRNFQKERNGDFWQLPTQIELVSYLAGISTLPDWVSEIIAFERDVLLVAEGQDPAASRIIEKGPSGFVVHYGIPVVDTVNSFLKGAPLPAAQSSKYLLSVENESLTVRQI